MASAIVALLVELTGQKRLLGGWLPTAEGGGSVAAANSYGRTVWRRA